LGLAAGATELGVVYTGRLIGYERACAEERFVPGKFDDGTQYYDRECAGGKGGYGEALAKLSTKARAESERSILLGAGDHFSLDYRARSVVVKTKAGNRAVGKDELLNREGFGWVVLSDADPAKFTKFVEG